MRDGWSTRNRDDDETRRDYTTPRSEYGTRTQLTDVCIQNEKPASAAAASFGNDDDDGDYDDDDGEHDDDV